LIDEEDKQSSRHFGQKQLEAAQYLWTLDPIDGTRAFSNRIPLFGISIGLLRELRPWLGAVYFPVLGELFYCDGESAYFVQNAFTAGEKRVRILPVDQEITRQSVFFGNDALFKKYDWNFDLCQLMLPACAVIDFCWPSIGRGAGCLFDSYIWDFGGSWPIARAAGLDIRSIKTGQTIERLEPGLFHGHGALTWRLKENCLLSSQRNFAVIAANGLIPKQR
jgi:fructose-1,6-bisphosphatase/inositol monophosphatase family enzyme